MKLLNRIVLAFTLMFVLAFGQSTDNKICLERGHVMGNYCLRTLLVEYTEIIDLPDRTLIIHHDPNTTTYTCQRCGKEIVEPGTIDTTIIWIKTAADTLTTR